MSQVPTFATTVAPVGGGGGGGGKSFVEREALEKTIGSVVLDRANKYPIGSFANRYRDNGGSNPTVIAVLEKAFGNDFDDVAAKGREHITTCWTTALTEALRAEGLISPTTPAFRDFVAHLDPAVALSTLLRSVRKIDANQ